MGGAAVGVWAIGCIWVEMLTKEPLFPVDSEIDELYQIFQCLGTPMQDVWPTVGNLPDYSLSQFPRWQGSGLKHLTPDIGKDGVELIYKLLAYNPAERITAKSAVQDPYFDDIRESVMGKFGDFYANKKAWTDSKRQKLVNSSNEV